MALYVVRSLILSLLSYLLWKVLRPFLISSPLKNIPGPPRTSWLKGDFLSVFNRDAWQFHRDLVKKYGEVVRLSWILGDEELYIADPLALHHIVVKDQYIFEETDQFIHSNATFFGTSLLSTLGEQHRRHRKMLNPVFSLKHMRDLAPIFYPIAHQLRDVLKRQMQHGNDFDVLKWISRAALEYIGQGGLGYTFDALDESKSNTYSEAFKQFTPTNFKLFFARQFLPYVVHIGSPKFRRGVIDWLPWPSLKLMRELVDTLHYSSSEILRQKTEALEKGDEEVMKQIGSGKDIMSVLFKANTASNEDDRLTRDDLLGHMNTFIVAGHDTSSSALARILHQLALNQDVQSRLRDEVTAARKEHGDLEYDILMGLPYLDAVCRETLRVFPPVPTLMRTTRKDVVLPLLWPIKAADGKTEIKEIPIKKNTGVLISVLTANRCKKIWGEDAEEWRPERWLKPLPDSVSKAHLPGVYASMMTFLGGGRACIGFKFAETEIKLVLSILLETFIFSPGSKQISWAMSNVVGPYVRGEEKTQLPLKVSLVEH